MTDEEYDALDERLTKTVPTLGPNGIGFFSSKGVQAAVFDKPASYSPHAKARATRRTSSEKIADLG
ncbi:MAG: hypothetical protein LBT00_00330 [Spirochaetaceae bacterium]|nr:hypothetical protein [Spirochaetaceae bacterium]